MANSFQNSTSEGAPIPSEGQGSFRGQSVLLLAALGSIFLAGGPMEGGMGIFLLLAGLVLVLTRPAGISSWVFWGLAGLLIVATSAALLPQEWMENAGVRAYIRSVPILMLPKTISLDPLATGFWIQILAVSLLIALYSLSCRLKPRGMEKLALLAVLGCCLYALVALNAWQTGWVYPFFEKQPWAQPAFGFFPNRNHTAGFLLTGAILSLGLIHRGVKGGGLLSSLVGGCGFALLVSVLLFNSVSRAGLLFLLLGGVIWVCGLGRHRSRAFLFGGGALALILAILFLSSGSGLLDRLKGNSSGDLPIAEAASPLKNAAGGGSFGEMRLKIWQDTLSIIAENPLTGTGLGSYAVVYPFYANKSLRDQSTALHAESDWLTLCAEEGLPALLIVLAIFGFLVAQIPKIAARSGREWPLRWAFISACFTEVLHGLVDVPLHKPELGWWVLLLGGIGFGGGVGKSLVAGGSFSRMMQRGVFLLGGILAIFLGGMMIRAQWGSGAALPPFAPGVEQKKIVELYNKGDVVSVNQAIEEARRAIREYPMTHQFYFQLAKILLNSKKNVTEATQLLEAEQAISPNDPDIVFTAGWMLAVDAPKTTATFWNEALRRQMAYDDSPNSAIHRTGDLYRQMISTALGNWSLFDRLPAIATNKELRLIWLNQRYCNALLSAEAARDASFMGELTPKEQASVIALWWQRGEKKEVETFLDEHPEYEEAAVSTRLAILAASGQEEKACRFLVESFQISTPELSDQPSETVHLANEEEVPSESLAAAMYFRNLGNDVTARRYLAEALNGPERSDALRFRAVLEMRAGDWKAALTDLTAYLKSTGVL